MYLGGLLHGSLVILARKPRNVKRSCDTKITVHYS